MLCSKKMILPSKFNVKLQKKLMIVRACTWPRSPLRCSNEQKRKNFPIFEKCYVVKK
jgi:hypothetical protein